MVNITFSWDDGAIEDMKLLDLSLKYSIPGIFFIPATNPERSVISKEDIKSIAINNFEIGAHTFSHAYLTKIPLEKAEEEMAIGKAYLEQFLGKEVSHFCFPGGKFNPKLVEVSRQYFKSARTADTGSISHDNSFLIKPTFHFYNRGKKSLIFNGIKNSFPISLLAIKNILSSDYFEIIKKIIEDLSNSNDIAYVMIWGHSWEIEKYELWGKLEDLFQDINGKYPGNILSYSDFLKCGIRKKDN